MDKIDILDRRPFVEKVIKLIENISDNDAGTCFAIKGTWGSGKSFVLDMIEEQLEIIQSEETSREKYFVVRYNCWKYDYYDEPLIAIVSAIIAEIEEKTKIFPDSQEKQEIIGMFKAAGVSLISLANTAFKEKTGIDIQGACETVMKGEKEGTQKYENDHAYDTYFSLNKVVDKLSNLLQKIASEYKVVIIVDELDRCIPEYAIKVLERLHHLTEGQRNIITIVAIDKFQLCKSVKHLFGFDNPEKYLEKFIHFEIKLGTGTVSELITEKYIDYIKLFDKDIFQFEDSVEECLQVIFKGIDIRTQEQIVKKIMITHKLLFGDKKDYSFMCMEVLTAVMICVYKYRNSFNDRTFNISSYGGLDRRTVSQFGDFFTEKFKNLNLRNSDSFPDEPMQYILPFKSSLYGAMLFTWCWMHNKRDAVIQYERNGAYTIISDNYKELVKFAEMIDLMQ